MFTTKYMKKQPAKVKAYSRGGAVTGDEDAAPRSASYSKLSGRQGEPEGYDSRDGQIGGGYEPPGSPAPQRKR